MAIDILHDNAIKAMPGNVASTRNTNVRQVKSNSESANAATLSKDDVVFTDNAKNLSRAAQIAYASDGIDYDKVAKIKQQLADGSFDFNYERVASKMMSAESEISGLL